MTQFLSCKKCLKESLVDEFLDHASNRRADRFLVRVSLGSCRLTCAARSISLSCLEEVNLSSSPNVVCLEREPIVGRSIEVVAALTSCPRSFDKGISLSAILVGVEVTVSSVIDEEGSERGCS